jgi:peptide/nickel transport system substrate-binding protein/oligopeptide transport system substrate-binding protein
LKKYILLLFFVVLCGCSIKQPHKEVIRIRLKEDPTTLDPARIVDVAGASAAAKIYNGLAKINEKGDTVPDLAESWNVSLDGKEYTFKLRKNIRFTDGSPLVAKDIVNAFNRVVNKSPRKWIFNNVSEIKVLDDYTLRILLKERFTPFIEMLALPTAYISKEGNVGTGPYKLIMWEHDKRIVLEENKYYFGDIPKINHIEYIILPDEFSAQAEFELGNIDIMEVSPIQWKTLIKWKETPKQFSQTGLNIYYIGFDLRKPLFQNLRFRQAMNYAIDRELIIKSVLVGQAEPAFAPVPPCLLQTKKKFYYKFLPNKSRKLFNAMMLENPVRLYVRAQAQAIQIAEAIQYYLGKAGVRIIIVPLEWSAFKSAIDNGECDMFLMSWWADYPDPENFLFPTFHSSNIGGGGNRSYFKNKAIDKLIETAQKEMDANKRNELYETLNRYLNRYAPWLFLWNAKELYITQGNIEGFRLYPLYYGDKGIEIEIKN